MITFTALGLVTAFGAGILSFLAPCVLPLVPSYLSYLAGVSLQGARSQIPFNFRVSLHALWFVTGFALLFTLLGAVTASLGLALSAYQVLLERMGGVLLILFGIVLTGWIPLPWLSQSYHLQVKPGGSVWWRSGLIGIAFGASWSACTGPILGAILILTAGSARSIVQGAIVMLTFALGLGVPFLLVGLLVDRISPVLRRIRRATALLTTIGGVILILLGIFLLTGLFSTSG
jgi:cytochrome c-type biogenesis protein